MTSSELTPEIVEKIRALEQKYRASGQDLASYLEGLLHADYLTYWDYVHLDTLLTLQVPRTTFPDELIFITYHQITELFFKLIRSELAQLTQYEAQHQAPPPVAFFFDKVGRINRYYQFLGQSFTVMIEGLDREQFLQFRMSLLPSSGFQSAQYRHIEIAATDFIRLVSAEQRADLANADLAEMQAHLYWKRGATELATGQKTLTLRHFEAKYDDELLRAARQHQACNLRRVFHQMPAEAQAQLADGLRTFDYHANVNWPLMHYRSAARHLQQSPQTRAATGGTNWQQYLPPRLQQRMFYPELWDEAAQSEWGKRLRWDDAGLPMTAEKIS